MNNNSIIKSIKLKPNESDFAKRVDLYLSNRMLDISRSRLKLLIKEGYVNQNKVKITDPNHRINNSDYILINIPKPLPSIPKGENIPLEIHYEDDFLIVINKQSGLVVHPGAGNPNGTLVNALISHCGEGLTGVGGVERPGIVHRIDKDTSGLLVIAKNDTAHNNLSEQFSNHTIKREYETVVFGILKETKGKIETFIKRSSTNRVKMSVNLKVGKNAITHYEVKNTFGMVASHLICRLETGRTHQIRVHMSHIGNSIIGDQIYKSSKIKLSQEIREKISFFDRQALHARSLSFVHPKTNKIMDFNVSPPDDFMKLISVLSKI